MRVCAEEPKPPYVEKVMAWNSMSRFLSWMILLADLFLALALFVNVGVDPRDGRLGARHRAQLVGEVELRPSNRPAGRQRLPEVQGAGRGTLQPQSSTPGLKDASGRCGCRTCNAPGQLRPVRGEVGLRCCVLVLRCCTFVSQICLG